MPFIVTFFYMSLQKWTILAQKFNQNRMVLLWNGPIISSSPHKAKPCVLDISHTSTYFTPIFTIHLSVLHQVVPIVLQSSFTANSSIHQDLSVRYRFAVSVSFFDGFPPVVKSLTKLVICFWQNFASKPKQLSLSFKIVIQGQIEQFTW